AIEMTRRTINAPLLVSVLRLIPRSSPMRRTTFSVGVAVSFDVVIDALIGRRNLVGGSIPFASSRGMHRWDGTCQKSPELSHSFWNLFSAMHGSLAGSSSAMTGHR
ncbi:MAG: hypothetical protein ACK55Z_17995, partial [bacterium]